MQVDNASRAHETYISPDSLAFARHSYHLPQLLPLWEGHLIHLLSLRRRRRRGRVNDLIKMNAFGSLVWLLTGLKTSGLLLHAKLACIVASQDRKIGTWPEFEGTLTDEIPREFTFRSLVDDWEFNVREYIHNLPFES